MLACRIWLISVLFVLVPTFASGQKVIFPPWEIRMPAFAEQIPAESKFDFIRPDFRLQLRNRILFFLPDMPDTYVVSGEHRWTEGVDGDVLAFARGTDGELAKKKPWEILNGYPVVRFEANSPKVKVSTTIDGEEQSGFVENKQVVMEKGKWYPFKIVFGATETQAFYGDLETPTVTYKVKPGKHKGFAMYPREIYQGPNVSEIRNFKIETLP